MDRQLSRLSAIDDWFRRHTHARIQETRFTRIVRYTAWDGRLHPMAAHPGKVTHRIHKVPYNIQKCQRPDAAPSEYPNPTASVLKYYKALASRLKTSNTHNLAGIDQNGVLKVALHSWESNE